MNTRGLYHERMVIVDRTIEFVGGIDLCYKHRKIQDHESEHVKHSGSVDCLTCEQAAYAFFGSVVSDAAVFFIQMYKNANTKLEPPLKFPHFLNVEARSEPSFTNLASTCVKASVQHLSNEFAIANAYLHTIRNAKKFIYIRKNFFISSENMQLGIPERVRSALTDRISRAHKISEDFHVLFFATAIPELSFFNQESVTLNDRDHEFIRALENSLFTSLLGRNVSREAASKYFSLHASHYANAETATDIVFAHSDVMIVDDQAAVVGTINVIGDRKVAWIIEDIEMVRGRINGIQSRVGKFSHGLRHRLLEEYLRVAKIDKSSLGDRFRPYI